MPFFRRLLRLARLSSHLAVGLWHAVVMFRFYPPANRDRFISRWSAKLLRILGVRLVAGPPPRFAHGALLVANHVSWLDIFAIHAVKRVYFVSKHEVRAWPLVGWLADRTGTLFVQRTRKRDTARINAAIGPLLQGGAWVAVFPEGTTTDGRRLGRFMPSLFEPATRQNVPVVPVALRYQAADGNYSSAAAYVDNMSFAQSLWQIAGEKEIVVRLDFGNPIQHTDRRSLAEEAERVVATCLGFASRDTTPDTAGGLQASAQ